MNNTVIKGTPLHSSINPIEVYLIAGSLDLLPNAKIVPIGKQNIKANAETMNVNESPPQAPVSTYFKPKSPPDISFRPIIGYTNNKKIMIYFLSLWGTKKEAPTSKNSVKKAFKVISEKYGGIDILISNAGTAVGGEIAEVDDKILRNSFEDNFFSHQNCASETIRIMKKQNTQGCLLFNISKQAVNPGKNFGPYGLPKTALLNLCKQYAVDYGSIGIRSNGVNADRIRSGLLNDSMIKSRAKSIKVSTDNYMRGNLLLNEVKAEDVAKAFFHLAVSKKTTGAVLTVDGGNIAASLR